MSYSVQYIDDVLHMEGVSVYEIAKTIGTPCFVYSHDSIVRNYTSYADSLSAIEPIICFSTKANSNIAVLKSYANLGAGFDIVSSGELNRVVAAGGDTSRVVFSGVGKTESEIKESIDAGILFFNIESEEELIKINSVASAMGKTAPVALRVNPDIDPDTHPYISTGFKKSKFGIEIGKSVEVYKQASKLEGINIVGIDAHIGSQIFDLSSFSDSVKKLVELADSLRENGIDISYIDIGGGLGISYRNDEIPPSISDYTGTIISALSGKPYKIVLEPGRSLIGNSGIMVSRVLYTKEGTSKSFVIVDAAMNDLIRPAFYNSYHEILTVKKNVSAKKVVDIVGPICESGDFLAVDRDFPQVSAGDFIAVLSTGAYGFVMASNYNSRPRAAEVMVNGDEFAIIRERENFEDLIRGESIPEFLK